MTRESRVDSLGFGDRGSEFWYDEIPRGEGGHDSAHAAYVLLCMHSKPFNLKSLKL